MKSLSENFYDMIDEDSANEIEVNGQELKEDN